MRKGTKLIIIRRREKINWWWFLFISGIVIPVINLLLTHFPSSYVFFPGLFVTGLNPYIGDFFNFFVLAVVCIFFKLLSRSQLQVNIARVIYFFSAAAVLYLFLGFLLPGHVEMAYTPHRAYIGYNTVPSKNEYYKLQNLVYIILAVLTFILFFIINFPKSFTKKI